MVIPGVASKLRSSEKSAPKDFRTLKESASVTIELAVAEVKVRACRYHRTCFCRI
jgi:hypothetical protein